MILQILFGDQSKLTSYSEWITGNDVVATAVLTTLLQRFPDAIQNIEGSPDRVVLRTRSPMPEDWVATSRPSPH